MDIRTIQRTAVGGYLRLARVPLDVATRLLPGGRAGARGAAQTAVDRVDATARALAGTLLGDPTLREDARRRRAALQERSRAVRLREQAEHRRAQGEAVEEERHEQARGRRRRAEERTADRRRQAQERKQQEQTRARTAARRRVEKSRDAEEQVEEKIEAQAPERRLEALEAESEAQAERERALTARDEAERLGRAAAAVKQERKQD